MNGWVDGWTGGRVDGWMGGWVDGWMDGWLRWEDAAAERMELVAR